MTQTNQVRRGGFSLIELLVALAIIGILASIAYPSYAAYVLRARRLEGMAALFEMMQMQERWYTRSNTYVAYSADTDPGKLPGFKWWSAARPAESAYELRARECEGTGLAQCVEIIAMPGTQLVDGRFRDPDCGALILSSTGEQRAEGTGNRCWQGGGIDPRCRKSVERRAQTGVPVAPAASR